MKKHRNPFYSALAVLGLVTTTFLPTTAAIAETPDVPEPYASVTAVPYAEAPNSGYFNFTLSGFQTASFRVVVNNINTGSYSISTNSGEPIIDGRALLEFSNLAPGDEVVGCLKVESMPSPVCSTVYRVPTGGEFNDTDGDGILDNDDACMNEPAPGTLDGCLPDTPEPVDTDGDGVLDVNDECDNEPAPGTPNGCLPVTPEPVDTDGDGVFDDGDECDNEPAQTPNGCPVVVPPPTPTTVVVYVNEDSLKQGCPAGQEIVGAHFLITQSRDQDGNVISPSQISVTLSSGATVVVNRFGTTGSTSHYNLVVAPGTTVEGASASLPSTWAGQFNLSDYRCAPVDVPEEPVDVCPDMEGDQAEGTVCNIVVPPVDVCTNLEGDQPAGTDCNPVVPPVDACPNMGGDQAEGTDCYPVVVTPTPVVNTPVVTPPAVIPAGTSQIVSEVDETNGRGVTAETAATEQIGGGTETPASDYSAAALSGLLVLLGALWLRRRATV